MSNAAAAVPEAPPLRPLTSEASNVLGWWWLAIVTTIVLLCSMWPSIFPDPTAGGMSAMSTYLLVIVSVVLVAVGAWVGWAFAKAQPWSARAMRMISMIGLIVGLVGVGFFLYSVAFAPASSGGQTFWGPSGVLAGIMWAMIMILPFIFGLTLIFGLMNDAVDEWFNPPVTFSGTTPSLRVDPKTAAIMAGGMSASMGDEALMGELSEAMSLTDKSAARLDLSEPSIEVVDSADEDLSVEVLGDSKQKVGSSDSMEELAALERALTKDASSKSNKSLKGKKKEEKKVDIGHGDEPLKVDDDFKL